MLPSGEFDLGVADVTLAQFEALAKYLNRNDIGAAGKSSAEWALSLSKTMVSLDSLLRVSLSYRATRNLKLTTVYQDLPLEVNVVFDLAYPSEVTRVSHMLTRQDLNGFVDSVLQTIFEVSDTLETRFMRRKIAFTSFSPDVCSALNWKQPNYPVFLGSICGRDSIQLLNPTASGSGKDDKRVFSVGAAVEFAKANNLLGLFVNSELLVCSSFCCRFV